MAAGMFVLWLGWRSSPVPVPDALVYGWLVLLVVGGRSAVRVWSARHRRGIART